MKGQRVKTEAKHRDALTHWNRNHARSKQEGGASEKSTKEIAIIHPAIHSFIHLSTQQIYIFFPENACFQARENFVIFFPPPRGDGKLSAKLSICSCLCSYANIDFLVHFPPWHNFWMLGRGCSVVWWWSVLGQLGNPLKEKELWKGGMDLTWIVNGRSMYLDEWRVGGVSDAEGSVEAISVENDSRRWGRLQDRCSWFLVIKREENGWGEDRLNGFEVQSKELVAAREDDKELTRLSAWIWFLPFLPKCVSLGRKHSK